MKTRIIKHVRIKAANLVPHELNFRTHPDAQRAALQALYDEIGFARSLLAYELPDGRLKLIDGHLRQALTPEEEVDVEVLDVNDEEARKLLLSIDPLAQLAQTDQDIHAQLREITASDNEVLNKLWAAAANEEPPRPPEPVDIGAPKIQILIDCTNEDQQKKLLARFKKEKLKCKALLS